MREGMGLSSYTVFSKDLVSFRSEIFVFLVTAGTPLYMIIIKEGHHNA